MTCRDDVDWAALCEAVGWEIAHLEAAYHDHVSGWDFYIPRIADVALRRVAAP